MKYIEYGLSALTLSEEECTQIMWPILKSFLLREGIQQNFWEVLYGNADFNGSGVKNIYLT